MFNVYILQSCSESTPNFKLRRQLKSEDQLLCHLKTLNNLIVEDLASPRHDPEPLGAICSVAA